MHEKKLSKMHMMSILKKQLMHKRGETALIEIRPIRLIRKMLIKTGSSYHKTIRARFGGGPRFQTCRRKYRRELLETCIVISTTQVSPGAARNSLTQDSPSEYAFSILGKLLPATCWGFRSPNPRGHFKIFNFDFGYRI